MIDEDAPHPEDAFRDEATQETRRADGDRP